MKGKFWRAGIWWWRSALLAAADLFCDDRSRPDCDVHLWRRERLTL